MVGYEIVNMFSDRPFTGSVLGVVSDAEGLSTQAMQAIAREINLPETTFVLPPSSATASYCVRVFTPTKESPFGGHSSIGTASTLVRLQKIPAGRIVQECGTKLLTIWATADGATVMCTEPCDGSEIDALPLLAGCCLERECLADTPRSAGFGPLFHYLPVQSNAIPLARLDAEKMSLADL